MQIDFERLLFNRNYPQFSHRMIRKDGNQAFGFVCNLSNKHEIYSVSKAVKSQVGDISILINNAGIVSGTSLLDTPDGKDVEIFLKYME